LRGIVGGLDDVLERKKSRVEITLSESAYVEFFEASAETALVLLEEGRHPTASSGDRALGDPTFWKLLRFYLRK
jgi:hypothetical protein